MRQATSAQVPSVSALSVIVRDLHRGISASRLRSHSLTGCLPAWLAGWLAG